MGRMVLDNKGSEEMSEPFLLPDVQKILRGIKGQHYLEEWNQKIPVCKGCFNEFGNCGTPCVDCERAKAWHEEWVVELTVFEKYIVWRRK